MKNSKTNNMIDTRFNQQKRNLIELLKNKGITDNNVLDAFLSVPRERFIIPAFMNRAYEDTALPIDENQTISQPYTVAFMTQCLEVKKNNKILEIGTGSGYQASILAAMGAKVFSIERIPALYNKSKDLFRSLNIPVNSKLSDGTLGWREMGPFDGIIITAGAPDIPNTLLSQLKIGGRMVAPIGDKINQDMFLIIRTADNNYDKFILDKFQFVPLIGKEGWNA